MTRSRLLMRAAVVLTAALVAPLAACTSHPVDPERAGTVVVAVDSPFTSLNAGLPEGRTAGSTLVRGLVQDELVGLDGAGTVVTDPRFGTVAKVSDSPLTVRYTIAPGARWSDGVAVSPADLLLDWAARSGRFDAGTPAQGRGPTTTAAAPASPATTTAAAPASPATTTAAAPGAAPGAADGTVRFGATSAAVLAASATPTLDAQGMTVVYTHPVADWQVALDVDIPAHVVGRLAALGAPTPGVSPTAAAASSAGAPQPAVRWASDEWAQAVAEAVVGDDRAALARISQVWRTGFDASALAADPGRAVTTGPYRIASVDPAGSVTMVRNSHYSGARPAARDRIVVRWNLDPLAAVDALRAGAVDVVAPVVTPDVTAALARVPGAHVATGGGAVLQLQLNTAAGPFSAAGAGDGAAARQLRAAFLDAAPGAALAAAGGAEPSDVVLASVGAGRASGTAATAGAAVPGAGAVASVPAGASGPTPTAASGPTSAATSGPTSGATPGSTPAATSSAVPSSGGLSPSAPVTVRVLVATGDPVRAAMLAALTAAVRPAGFVVTVADPADPSTALWSDRASWDAALVPVPQTELPVAGVVDAWRTGGATNATGLADPTLDAMLDQLGRTPDPAAIGPGLAQVAAAVRAAQVVEPVGRQPSLTATASRAAGSGLPEVGTVPAVPWGSADLSSWWSWAVQRGS